MTTRICFAGATGWAGSELARHIAQRPDMEIVSAVSRNHQGKVLGDVLQVPTLTAPIFATVEQALSIPCDVLFEYTSAQSAKAHVLQGLAHGVHVVVGASGLSDEDYQDIDAFAQQAGCGVLACGNFSLSAGLLQKCALLIAQYMKDWEVIEYASQTKKDVPSGTVRELLSQLPARTADVPNATVEDQRIGLVQARGAVINGTHVHALRLPSFVLGVDVVFGHADETISIRQNAGSGARPYVSGALRAIEQVTQFIGLQRALQY